MSYFAIDSFAAKIYFLLLVKQYFLFEKEINVKDVIFGAYFGTRKFRLLRLFFVNIVQLAARVLEITFSV